MARIVSKSRAGENGAKPRALAGLPQANYSAFRPRGETRSCLEIAHIQQFRVYILDRSTCNFRIARAGRSVGTALSRAARDCRPCGPRWGYDSHSPDKGISTPHGRIQT